MGKRYRVLLIAAFVAALAVPVGYALSIEPQPPAATMARTTLAGAPSAAVIAAPMTVHVHAVPVAATSVPATSLLTAVPDAGKLLLVGTLLFGLSALVRRAT